MSPKCIYWMALLIVVLPSAFFNRVAATVLLVWLFGHVVHWCAPTVEDSAYMFARIVACGAALGLAKPWELDRRTYANIAVALLFLPSAYLAATAAANFHGPPQTTEEYGWQVLVYWSCFGVIMLQALIVPFGNDWKKIGKSLSCLDAAIMRILVHHFGGPNGNSTGS